MFRIVQRPEVYPGAGILGVESKRGYVDTSCEMPVGGRVYLEELAVDDCTRLFGGLPRAEAEGLREALAETRQDLQAAMVELVELRELRDAVRGAAA